MAVIRVLRAVASSFGRVFSILFMYMADHQVEMSKRRHVESVEIPGKHPSRTGQLGRQANSAKELEVSKASTD